MKPLNGKLNMGNPQVKFEVSKGKLMSSMKITNGNTSINNYKENTKT